MMVQEPTALFNFRYEKTAAEIKTAAGKKIIALNEKIAERERRIATLREEYGIDDSVLAQLLVQARRQAAAQVFTYTSNSVVGGSCMEEKTIGAGVVNNLLTESDFVEAEKSAVTRLELIIRNLRPLQRITQSGGSYAEDAFILSYDELMYMGF